KLVPRSVTGSVLDHDKALSQVEQLLTKSQVTSIDGVAIPLIVRTICVHADTPDAVKTAKDVRALLLELGIELKGFHSNG
ncbi:MAG: LamB/YcsF family protein, partial [Actinobacteria bacterium]|nr:LamB/YcsF family protein [Actinomycetota bacterium]